MPVSKDFDLQDEDYAAAYLKRKIKRSAKRKSHKKHERKLLKSLIRLSWCKPSIWPECDPENDYEYTGRIRRAKHSRQQKWMKKYSAKVVRKLPEDILCFKGNHYRRWFDYWNVWL